jgi:hypothetical protein
MEFFSLEKMGARLRLVRQQLGFGGDKQLRAFCREHKLNPTVWGKLEKGTKSTLYVQSVVSLCEQFDLAPTWLLFGEGPQRLSARDLKANVPGIAAEITDAAIRQNARRAKPGRKRSGTK